MEVEQVLEKYGLTRGTVTAYIDAVIRMNMSQTADEIDVSTDTAHRYKRAFQEMTPVERTLVIASLAQDKLLHETTKR